MSVCSTTVMNGGLRIDIMYSILLEARRGALALAFLVARVTRLNDLPKIMIHS